MPPRRARRRAPRSWALGEAFAPPKCAAVAPGADADAAASQHERRVRRADVDMNAHVNNARYIAWLLEDVPADVAEARRASGCDVEYRAECGMGDDVRSTSAPQARSGGNGGNGGGNGDGGVSYDHALFRGRDGAEVLRARTLWLPPQPQLARAAE
jgi:hypothetical protein